jgi:hypothetical protein
MTAIVLLSSLRPDLPPRDGLMVIHAPANDDQMDSGEMILDPEGVLEVSFAGISASEQERALASFPGGRRCVLAA